nr:TraX coupling peptide [uncultured bacterium]
MSLFLAAKKGAGR